MATITKNKAHRDFGGMTGTAPYGNLAVFNYQFITTATGAVAGGNSTAAAALGDMVVLGTIPGGTKLLDMKAVISEAFTASTNFNLGFMYVDGVNDIDVPHDAMFFADTLSSASTAVQRMASQKVPVTLPKDAYLILTVGGASHASSGRMDISIFGEIIGLAG